MQRVFFAAAALLLAAPSLGALPCDADMNDDGEIGIEEFLWVIGAWGTPDADVDGDGQTGISDFLYVLGNFGEYDFDYPPPLGNAEAEQIGLEMLGIAGLLVPPDDYDRIVSDLMLVRHAEPALETETHSPAWIPNQLIVGLVDEAPLDEYLCLNQIWQVVDIQVISQSLNIYLLTLPGNLNPVALAQEYEAAPEVAYAEPNGIFGGQNFWVPTEMAGGVWQWSVDDGFLDCFDGCDCHRFYVFETDGEGNVELISYQEIGQPWCEFGSP